MAFSQNPRILRTASGEVPQIIDTMKEANSQSFKTGQLVYAAGSGTTGAITVCADGATVILGIAQAAATNVTSGNAAIAVEVIRPGDRIAIQCYDSNAGALKLASALYPGKAYGIVTVANVAYANQYNTTNDALVFVEPLDTTNYPYWGIFEPVGTVCQMSIGE